MAENIQMDTMSVLSINKRPLTKRAIAVYTSRWHRFCAAKNIDSTVWFDGEVLNLVGLLPDTGDERTIRELIQDFREFGRGNACTKPVVYRQFGNTMTRYEGAHGVEVHSFPLLYPEKIAEGFRFPWSPS